VKTAAIGVPGVRQLSNTGVSQSETERCALERDSLPGRHNRIAAGVALPDEILMIAAAGIEDHVEAAESRMSACHLLCFR
jgi:hypothetical protein